MTIPPLQSLRCLAAAFFATALSACASMTTATTARSVPKGEREAGVSAEVQSITQSSSSWDDDEDNSTMVATTAFARWGVADSVDVGLRGAFVPLLPFRAVAGWVQGDAKLVLLQGRAGAVAFNPAAGIAASSAQSWSSDSDDLVWRVNPAGHLPLLVALGSDDLAAVFSIGPSAIWTVRDDRYIHQRKGWMVVALRMTAGLSFRVSDSLRLQPEAVLARPLSEDHSLEVVGGGIALGWSGK